MYLDGIYVFIKVVQLGSFTLAAKRLNMPVTTVSGRVSQLEQKLGVTLLTRTTRKISLTLEGERFYRGCENAISELEYAHEELGTSKEHVSGTLKITAPRDVVRFLLMDIVLEFKKKYPDIEVEMMATNRLVDLAIEGIDLAVRVGPLKESSLIQSKIFSSSAHLYASPKYLNTFSSSLSLKTIGDAEFLLYTGQKEQIELMKGDATYLISDLITSVKVDDMELLKELAINAKGIASLPDFICLEDVKKGRLLRVLPSFTSEQYHYYFLYPSAKFLPQRVRSFIDMARESL
ncbi:LysR family transcriptional regulator [Halobacteriovorax sp. GB3]|uniref:LysR family transcriptional regulator n=1 Tax=Halobacteriovorax sp. GB3 TaxID=2719615 RepID=UPI0023612B37|nr:LysR family transcriptional regulator [Halobacteriovorax sp. GB3]MDD0854119.1 LysR family transcriptional regulator [Halobacteriovorax sp. GB3]